MTTNATDRAVNAAVGAVCAEARRAAGVSRAVVAAHLDMSAEALELQERGACGMSVPRLLALAAAVNADPIDLLADAMTRAGFAHEPTVQLVTALTALHPAKRAAARDLLRTLSG